jgi:hypothetical protein
MHAHTESRPQITNRILNALTDSEYERLSPHLDPVNLSPGETLYRPEQPVTHAYFTSRGAASLVSTFEDGDTVEVGMVGNGGMFVVCTDGHARQGSAEGGRRPDAVIHFDGRPTTGVRDAGRAA